MSVGIRTKGMIRDRCWHCINWRKDFDEKVSPAVYINLTKEQMIDFFLKQDKVTGDYETKHIPCDFLMEDGSCGLGDNRPDNCRDCPYTDQPERLWSLYSMLEAIEVCPVDYEIWERLKQEYRFRTRR